VGYVLCCSDCNEITEIPWDSDTFTCPVCGSVWEFDSDDDDNGDLYSWITGRVADAGPDATSVGGA